MFKSIRLKLTFYFALFLALILSSTSYLLYQNAYNNQIANMDGSLHVIIHDISNDIKEDELEETYDDIIHAEEEFKINPLYVRLIHYEAISKMQFVVAQTNSIQDAVFAPFNLEKSYLTEQIVYQTFNGHRTAMEKIIMEDKIFFLQSTMAVTFQKNTLLIFFAVILIIFLLSLLGFYLLVSKTFLVVRDTIADVNKIEAYDYTQRISTNNVPNEIQELVYTFNKLLLRHEESFRKISQFSSDASHELKTPLTTIRGEIEVGLRKKRSSEEYQQILEKSLSKIMEIQQLIDGLLFLARTDKLEIQSSFEEFYMDEIITECVKELKIMAIKKFITLELHLLPLTLKGNNGLLKIACINILKNAILYSSNNTKINITMQKNGTTYIISFQDEGIGIAKQDIEHIFDRFYRSDTNVTSHFSGGTGLGLSIVKMILDIHDFEIEVKSQLGKGTIVNIYLKSS
ncbi:MAG: Osmosensitive K+ channel histidine kinase KdpD (EC [uncultured Sulfurovum sp.]|uniref:histidine kinase n=1 Tax=uncultured Sulfurovum sp. TaxID=269237 RepID=A0A6S6SCJ1_9BACT|nr:MAG: Osmosensitive K+ channel histidine kinase KdpD (EC [uncultured Sulfurovum sp.]